MSIATTSTEDNPGVSIWMFVGLAAVLGSFLISAVIAYQNIQLLRRNVAGITRSHDVLMVLNQLLSLAKDAETGQRGFVITGDERYLAPFNEATSQISGKLKELESSIADEGDYQKYFLTLSAALELKIEELRETISLRRDKDFESARAVVATDRGKAAMDTVRDSVNSMQQIERETRRMRLREMESAYGQAMLSGLVSALIGAALTCVIAHQLHQSISYRLRQERLLSGQLKLNQMMSGEQQITQLGDNLLRFLTDFLQGNSGAFYTVQGGGFRRVSTFGVPADAKIPEFFLPGDGLLGQAVKDQKRFMLNEVPEGYLSFGSAFGSSKPKSLAILPIVIDGASIGVVELGFTEDINESMNELFDRAAESIATSIRSINYRSHLQELLEETQRQAEELQAQGEELRVSNEELEEQGRALRESQARLENQQAELEQTNSQLEEQTQLLEHERDEVARGKSTLEFQAKQLEAASRYKSEFLANMSHELRTPLNSSLILAKLLADNPAGNLTDEQVRFAETIQTAGNDLLTLINDILDLSKIEAGHLEIRTERVTLGRIADSLERTFRPIAQNKKLEFTVDVAADCPIEIQTDRQRLEQVLKNLLSNACKFTEAGSVRLTVSPVEGGKIQFSVTDTGIGIPHADQKIIFDAFRQADSRISRKYGGTGLGLSISRELSRLLGGAISVTSEPGQGSTFSVTIPEVLTQAVETPLISPAASTQRPMRAVPERMPEPAPVVSTRMPSAERLTTADGDTPGSERVLLIVEDDITFSTLLEEMARGLKFGTLVARNAEDGVAMAIESKPSAVILDLGLPDHSGLWVLDRLKHDPNTRHIPVHVISASDATQSALSLGAVGYLLKPVQKDDLVGAMEQLAMRLTDRRGRVLVIEDDPVQLDSVRRLLGSLNVDTIGASTAAEALGQLKDATFDCMVLDLSLPDATGYSLLQTLSEEDAYSFPPVVVYTGRDLSIAEEQKLRRYSKSIIIKGAKSPERLLDEVTLFLHQVVSELPPEHQRMLEKARSRDAALEGRRILVVEDDVRNVFALTSVLERQGAVVEVSRNGREALEALEASKHSAERRIDLVLMDVMMPEMDGLTAVRKIREQSEWRRMPVIMLTAKAMKDDQDNCISAGANDYMAKPLDVDKLLSLVRVWMPR